MKSARRRSRELATQGLYQWLLSGSPAGEIDAQLPSDLGPWLASLGDLRREVLAAMPAGDERKALLHELAHRQVCDAPTCPARTLVTRP